MPPHQMMRDFQRPEINVSYLHSACKSTIADAKLWRDWLAFLDGARTRGGILVRR